MTIKLLLIVLKGDTFMQKLLLIISTLVIMPIYSMEKSLIVKKLLDKKSQELEKEEKLPGEEALGLDLLKPYRELYPEYESKFDSYKYHAPVYEVAGGLSYGMNLDEMSKAINEKFKQMYQNGQIISREEFQKQNKDKWFEKGQDLTRIWGADYLSKKFKESGRTNIKIPKYIIVVNDLNKIKIRLNFSDICFPIIAQVINGEIYAEKIDGTPAAKKSMLLPGQELVGYGYTDYSAPGNILKTKDNIYYIVDTEYKSFYDGIPGPHLFKNVKGGDRIMCEYFNSRFKLINKVDSDDKIIELSVAQTTVRGK